MIIIHSILKTRLKEFYTIAKIIKIYRINILITWPQNPANRVNTLIVLVFKEIPVNNQ